MFLNNFRPLCVVDSSLFGVSHFWAPGWAWPVSLSLSQTTQGPNGKFLTQKIFGENEEIKTSDRPQL